MPKIPNRVKVVTERTITITLTEKEASLLVQLFQNPVMNCPQDGTYGEDDDLAELREWIFEGIINAQET